MKRLTFFIAILTLTLGTAGIVKAHEVRPGYLELKEVNSETYDILWKVPAKGDRRLGLYVRLPEHCISSESVTRFTGDAYIERWQATCKGGLEEGIITIDGLSASRTDVLARAELIGGASQTVRLTPSQPEFKVLGTSSPTAVALTYFKLGVEHILLGFDHLLFVLALLFLVGNWRRLVGTITAFTLAHSLTLAAATLGWVQVPQAPVEAVIALSIMFVAVEILHGQQGLTGIAVRKPWVVAFLFGLLHGLGFAGALREIGMPEHAIPLSLAFFNVGVEVGQLFFVVAAFLLYRLINGLMGWRAVAADRVSWLEAVTTKTASYVIGTLAAFWLIERTYGFFT